ncbi:unnamed protein product [Rhizophagus irregularis]|nr:unnamed protein product [Rhizophagus irregularis]
MNINPSTSTMSTTSSTLTTNQKHVLLFNINEPLEILIQEFDNNWWPLVSNIWIGFSYRNNVNGNLWKSFTCHFTKHNQSNSRKEGISLEKYQKMKTRPPELCFAKIKVSQFISEQKVRVERYNNSPDYTHLLDKSEKLKRSQVVRTLVEQEALKNYRPPAIVSAVKEFATEKLGLNESVKELRRKEVTNIKSKVRESFDTHLIGNLNRELDIQETIIFLKKQGYLVERYEVIHKPTSGFVLIYPNQINNLEQYGWLTLIDSTYKTNRYDFIYLPYIFVIHMVTTTNPLESYHSKLKKSTFPKYGLIGTCHKIVALDEKKRSDSKYVSFEFRTKNISAIGVNYIILHEIHKFPFPVQQMLVNEFNTVQGRIEKGKPTPGLISLNCNCLFFCQFLLPCWHIFYEHIYGNIKLLTVDIWKKFQKMFEKAGFEIYMHRELVEIAEPKKN